MTEPRVYLLDVQGDYKYTRRNIKVVTKDDYDALAARSREYGQALDKAREALARYPEMTDAEVIEAAGKVAALLFSEQGATAAAPLFPGATDD